MSASLVGSEMCIRDRHRAERRRRLAAHPRWSSTFQKHKFTQLEISVQAVSYTHLTLPTICSV
eukprot:7110908-Alexandrium_andersonii.AAC.1